MIVARGGSVAAAVDREGSGAWKPDYEIHALEIDEHQFRRASLTTLDGDELFTFRLDLGWACVLIHDGVGSAPSPPASDMEVEPGFLRWGETLAILRGLADAAVAVDGSSTWEIGRRGPPSGALAVRRGRAGTDVLVGDR